MEANSWAKFSEYGLIGLVVGALLFLFYRWSVWIMGWIKERDKEQAEERKEVFSISRLKREIEMNNRQIADLEKRNVELQAKINASVETLDLKI